MRQRVLFVLSAVGVLAALAVGGPLLSRSPTEPMGVLLIAVGAVPGAILLAAAPRFRRLAGALLAAAGTVLAVVGLGLASQHQFLELRLALIDWRILVHSAYGLASFGLMAAGLALALAGVGTYRRNRGVSVLTALVGIVTAGYFVASLVASAIHATHYRGGTWLDRRDLAVAIVLVFSACLLLAIAALSRSLLGSTAQTIDRAGTTDAPAGDVLETPLRPGGRARRRWVKPVVISGIGVAVLAGIGGSAWSTWGPRLVLGEVFPDQGLATCVAHAMGKAGPSAKVSHTDLTGVLSLSCNGALAAPDKGGASGNLPGEPDGTRIESINGLEQLPNLATLDLSNNQVSDLLPLAHLQKLGGLKLTNNQVTDLTVLAGLPVLSDLGLSGNALTDVTLLSRVPTLRFLGLAGNQIRDLTPLTGLGGLSRLDAGHNQVSDVTPLAGLSQLERLTLTENQISDPTPLKALPVLTMLNIAGNQIADAAGFAGFPELNELWLGNNPLTDVTPLLNCPSLTGVDLDGLGSVKLTGVEELRAHNVYVGGLA